MDRIIACLWLVAGLCDILAFCMSVEWWYAVLAIVNLSVAYLFYKRSRV